MCNKNKIKEKNRKGTQSRRPVENTRECHTGTIKKLRLKGVIFRMTERCLENMADDRCYHTYQLHSLFLFL